MTDHPLNVGVRSGCECLRPPRSALGPNQAWPGCAEDRKDHAHTSHRGHAGVTGTRRGETSVGVAAQGPEPSHGAGSVSHWLNK